VVLTDTLPNGTTFVSATPPFTQIGDVIRWDFTSLDVIGSHSVDLVVQVNLPAFSTLINSEYAGYSDQAPIVQGAPVSARVGSKLFLPFSSKGP
jgi:hypothetical protein